VLVGVIVFELHIPHARSLKAKRKVVKGLVERLHRRFKVSVIESDHHDLHQRAEISIAVVGLREGEIERMMDELRRTIEGQSDALITMWNDRILEPLD